MTNATKPGAQANKAALLSKLAPGMSVRFNCECGVIEKPDGDRFVGSVKPGDTGVVEVEHPHRSLRCWWLVRVPSGLVPVLPRHVEVTR